MAKHPLDKAFMSARQQAEALDKLLATEDFVIGETGNKTKKITEYFFKSSPEHTMYSKNIIDEPGGFTGTKTNFDLTFYPYDIIAFYEIVKKVDGVELGYIELHSNPPSGHLPLAKDSMIPKYIKKGDPNLGDSSRYAYNVKTKNHESMKTFIETLNIAIFKDVLSRIPNNNIKRDESLIETYERAVKNCVNDSN